MFHDKIELVTFGDSWPRGEELDSTERPFGHTVAELLNVKYYKNFSERSTSIEHMVFQLNEYLPNKHPGQSIAIFFVTGLSRSISIVNNKVQEIHPTCDNDASNAYYKYVYSEELAKLRFNTAISTLQRVCSLNNINDYYFFGWEKTSTNFPGIDETKFLPDTAAEVLKVDVNTNGIHTGWSIREPKYFKKYHPSADGHAELARYIHKFLNFQGYKD